MKPLVIALLLSLAGLPGFAQEAQPKKGTRHFTIGKETTYIDGPLDKDGFIDYTTALNERLRQGVTPENNAVVLLVKALGPNPDNQRRPAAYYRWLQIPAPPEKGDYFVLRAGDFLREHLKLDPREHGVKFLDEQDAAREKIWTAKQYPNVAKWLKINEKPLAVVIEASKRPRYYSPMVPSKPQEMLLAFALAGSQSRQLGTALTARAMLKAGEGRAEAAWQDLLAGHRLARHVARSGSFIESLVGLAIEGMAHDADLALIGADKLDAKQLKACLGDLQSLPALPVMADILDLGERYIYLDAVMVMDRQGITAINAEPGGKNDKATINWDPALKNGTKMYNEMTAVMRLADRGKREQALRDFGKNFPKPKMTGLEMAKAIIDGQNPADVLGEFTAERMAQLMMPAAGKLQHAAERAEQNHRNLQLAFALAAHKKEHGRYPKTLDALAPAYLKAIPDDLFSGKALIYRPSENGYLLYSVGVNGKDDDGASDDLKVRMPLVRQP